MKQCNWTIDQQANTVTLYKNEDGHDHTNCITVPFTIDRQYDMYMNFRVGRATVKNALVDYGSNGSITLKDDAFELLKDEGIIGQTLVQKGQKSSGIYGKPVDLKREFHSSDSVSIDSLFLEKMSMRSGHKSMVGTGFLSRFTVTIDWDDRQIHFSPTDEEPEPIEIVGFSLSYSPGIGMFVQSVVEPSNAVLAGIRPNMKVTKVDTLNFEEGADFCDYVFYEFGDRIFVEAVDSVGQKRQYNFDRTLQRY